MWSRDLRQRLVAAFVTVVVASMTAGCTEDPPATVSSASSISAPTNRTTSGTTTAEDAGVARTLVEPVGADVEISVLPANLTAAQEAGLRDGWGTMQLAVGVPVEITATAPVPTQGIRVTRTYPKPLDETAAATLAYWDPELDSWRAVASELSADRRAVTAKVTHLSLWTDIVTSVNGSIQDVADWGYYQVGQIFDVRAEPPTCTGPAPSWVADMIHIETNPNNSILFCTGRDPKHSDIAVVKATVNRGFAFTYTSPGEHAWTYNSSLRDQPPLQEIESILSDLGDEFAEVFHSMAPNGAFVAPEQELSFGLTQDQARALPDARALVLAPPDMLGFLLSILGQLIGAEVGLLADGYAGAAIAIASCRQSVKKAHDTGTFTRAAKECASSLDEKIAKELAWYLAKRGMDPKKAGKLSGHLIGKASIYFALIGPTFSGLNYWQERQTSSDSRTVSIFPKVIKDVTLTTLLSAEVPAYCNLPRQRLRDGKATEGSPGGGGLVTDTGTYAFGDLAKLGYQQGLAAYVCSAGGVGWPEVLILTGRGGKLLASFELADLGKKEHADVRSMTINGPIATIDWVAYEGAGFFITKHQAQVSYRDGRLDVADNITAYDPDAFVQIILETVDAGDFKALKDPSALDESAWNMLVALMGEEAGLVWGCVDQGDGDYSCEVKFLADSGTSHYATITRANTAYGWRLTEVQ